MAFLPPTPIDGLVVQDLNAWFGVLFAGVSPNSAICLFFNITVAVLYEYQQGKNDFAGWTKTWPWALMAFN